MYGDKGTMNSRMDMDIVHIFEKITEKPLPPFKKFIELEVSGDHVEDGVDCVMPTIVIKRAWVWEKKMLINDSFSEKINL